MEKPAKWITGLAVTLLLLSACSSESGDIIVERMLIKHHKDGCQGLYYQTCLLTRPTEQDPWYFFYDNIENFEFEWGYNYELLVLVADVPDPPADASSLSYTMVQLLGKVKVAEDSYFDFSLMPDHSFSERVTDTEFRLGQEVSFNCDLSTCDAVQSLLSQQMAMLLSFQHANDSAGQLRLHAIACSDTPNEFYETCLGMN